jgi:hypothetical protein
MTWTTFFRVYLHATAEALNLSSLLSLGSSPGLPLPLQDQWHLLESVENVNLSSPRKSRKNE